MADDPSDNDLATEVMSPSQLPGVTADVDDLFGETVSLTNECPACGMKFDDETVRCPVDGSLLGRDPDPEAPPASDPGFAQFDEFEQSDVGLAAETDFDDAPDTVVLTPEEAEDEDDIRGRVFEGRFRVDAVLGEGGMGRVYKGTQLSVDRPVAIKVIHGEISQREEIRKRFMREAQLISSFTHPNTVRLYDFGEAQGHLYIAMEYVDGVSLDRIVGRERLELDFVFEVLVQVSGALVEAHKSGVVHRDLKPENIFLTRTADGRLQTKLLDFGIAHVDQPMLSEAGLTERGKVVGTPEYMAPEQARGQDVTPATDVYALGVIFYEMVTGELPFEADSQMHTMFMQVSEPVPPVMDVFPGCPERIAYAIERMLAKETEDRPQTALQVLRALRKLQSEVGARPIDELGDGELYSVFREVSSPRGNDRRGSSPGRRDSSVPESVGTPVSSRAVTTNPSADEVAVPDAGRASRSPTERAFAGGDRASRPAGARDTAEPQRPSGVDASSPRRTALKRSSTSPGLEQAPEAPSDRSQGRPAKSGSNDSLSRRNIVILSAVLALIFFAMTIAALALAI